MQPLRGTDSIMWTIKFRNRNMKRFKFPICTTPEGSADPVAGKPKPNMADLESPAILFANDMRACGKSQLVRRKQRQYLQFIG